MRKVYIVFLAFMVAVSGCASYSSTSAPLPKVGAMPAWQTEGEVEIGADPYIQVQRQTEVFGHDLNKAGILPVQVYIQNKGKQKITVRPSDMVLERPDGPNISPAGASAASAKMESIAGVVGAGIAFGLIGVLVASNAEDKARAARLEDYQRKELKDAKLGKDESCHGFVYFIPGEGSAKLTTASLSVRVLNADDGRSFVCKVPLKHLAAAE